MAKSLAAGNQLTKKQLIVGMIFYLKNFASSGSVVDANTVHNTVLSDADGPTSSTSSKGLYRGLIRFMIKANGHPDKNWPNNWMDLSVQELADKIY